MSLFEITRYLGEGEEDKAGEQQDSANILKALQKEAKARKRSLRQENVRTNSEISMTEGIGNKTLSKSTEDSPVETEIKGEETITDEDIKLSKKKKKHKLKVESPVKELDYEDEIEDDDFQNIKKKNKKRKHKLSESEVQNESLIETEPDMPSKRIKIADTDTVSDEIQQEGKHKKNKKHKHKHTAAENVFEEIGDNDLKQDNNVVENNELNDSDHLLVEHTDMDVDDEKLVNGDDNDAGETDKDQKVLKKGKGNNEIGGFTVIGDIRPAKQEKVRRVLPDWLTNPSIISADLSSDKLPVSEMPGLAEDLVHKLKDNHITHFFPVQKQVIPALLESSLTGFQTGRAGYRPSDICVSAPTGSGKTLAFVLPIVQVLRSRVTCEVRALAVLPVRDLATQVFKVFQTYCTGTNLKVGLMIGQKTLLAEQQSLVKKRLRGYRSMFDIIVATPGRLVDHMNKTEGFNLGHLRYLVIDEADRMMEEIKQDWLIQVETAVYRTRPRPGPLTVASCQSMQMPVQKLLYSATLSQNPEKLQQLNLFQPKLFTSVVKAGKTSVMKAGLKQTIARANQNKSDKSKTSEMPKEADDDKDEDNTSEVIDKIDNKNQTDEVKKEEKSVEFVGKYATPTSLSEYYIESTPGEKPLMILHLLHHLKYRHILCFTKSIEDTHRLFTLIKLYGGVEVKEFSSGLHVSRRDAIIQKFMNGKIDILVCSDAMARGMDIANVKYVISYDPPPYIQTYIHRIGRTARAGKEGTAFTLLQKKEFFHFKKMVRAAGKGNLRAMKVAKADLKPLLPKYQETLKSLGDVLKKEKPRRKHTPKKVKTEAKEEHTDKKVKTAVNEEHTANEEHTDKKMKTAANEEHTD